MKENIVISLLLFSSIFIFEIKNKTIETKKLLKEITYDRQTKDLMPCANNKIQIFENDSKEYCKTKENEQYHEVNEMKDYHQICYNYNKHSLVDYKKYENLSKYEDHKLKRVNSESIEENHIGDSFLTISKVDQQTSEENMSLEQNNEHIFYPRRFFGISVFREKLQIFGGFNGDKVNNEVQSTIDGKTWYKTETKGEIFTKRDSFRTVVFHEKLYVLGGWAKEGLKWSIQLNTIQSSSDGIIWEKIETKGIFSPRSNFGAAVFRDKMYVLGGCDDSTNFNDVYSSSDGKIWDKVETEGEIFTIREGFGSEVFGEKIQVLAGAGGNKSKFFNDVYSTIDGIIWVKIETEGKIFSPRYYFGTAVFRGKLYVFGGSNDSQYFNDVYSTTDGKIWGKIETKGNIFTPREGFGTVIFGEKLLVLGGSDDQKFHNDIFQLMMEQFGIKFVHKTNSNWMKIAQMNNIANIFKLIIQTNSQIHVQQIVANNFLFINQNAQHFVQTIQIYKPTYQPQIAMRNVRLKLVPNIIRIFKTIVIIQLRKPSYKLSQFQYFCL